MTSIVFTRPLFQPSLQLLNGQSIAVVRYNIVETLGDSRPNIEGQKAALKLIQLAGSFETLAGHEHEEVFRLDCLFDRHGRCILKSVATDGRPCVTAIQNE